AGWHVLLMPLMILAVPLYDFVSVVGLRLLRGKSPMVGDHNHFSHRLVRRGLTPPRAVGVICLATLATGLAGVMLTTLAPWQAWLAGAQTLAVLAVLAVLERG
ncbi:MAG: undecaprenyl/decaprenyl-phosphate alpha-N-acetylglucosaminyl 1-phosphate transferase, partial [Planctomycetota bacterium]